MAADALFLAARELLDAALEAVAMTSGGPIERQYVSPGMPAIDCPPQITVHAGGPAFAETAPVSPPLQPGERTLVGSVNLVALTITVVRCTPTLGDDGDVVDWPDPGDLEASAAEIYEDLWTIWNHLATLKRSGALFPITHRQMMFDPATADRKSVV